MTDQPPQPRYDLRFRMLGFPVGVSPAFWAAALLLGGSVAGRGLDFLAAWVAALFVSVSVLIATPGHRGHRWRR